MLFGLIAQLVGYMFLFGFSLLVLGFIRTWAFVNLYELFVIPIYHLPQLSFLQAYGLIIFYNFFTSKTKEYKTDTEKDRSELINLFIKKVFIDIISTVAVVYIARFIAKFL